MSTYMGFEPTNEKKDYYFISYNTEDSQRVGAIAGLLSRSVPVWYDYAIPYGEEWEKEISVKIAKSKRLLVFFTKGILLKQDSYTQKEFRIAKRKGISRIIIFMDSVTNDDVPDEQLAFWDDVCQTQNVMLSDPSDRVGSCKEILRALGVSENVIGNISEKGFTPKTTGREQDTVTGVHGSSAAGTVSENVNGASANDRSPRFGGGSGRNGIDPANLEPDVRIDIIPAHKVGLFGMGYTAAEKDRIRKDGVKLLKDCYSGLSEELKSNRPDGCSAYRLAKTTMIIIKDQLGAYNIWKYDEDQAMNLFKKNYDANLKDIRNYVLNRGNDLPYEMQNQIRQILHGLEDVINILSKQ